MQKTNCFRSLGLLIAFLSSGCVTQSYTTKSGFVALPKHGFTKSAYMVCNPTGDYGQSIATPPSQASATCFVSNPELHRSEMFAPLDGFRMVGMLVADVPMPAPYASTENNAVATLSDTFWRNKSNTECILGTHLKMENVPLADGSFWEVNDIARAGFAGKEIEVAYFYKPHNQDEGGNTEMLFRVGRTFTSVVADKTGVLPTIKDAPLANTPISKINAAAISENWVNFTTDVSFKDMDKSTRQMTSMFYIKYPCDGRDVVEKEGAIRLRTTGQNGQPLMEVIVPGLVPVDAEVDRF